MPTLRNALHDLADTFASSVLHAIRGASLEELLGEAGVGARRGPGRPPKSTATPTASATPRARKSGRLPRRSAEQIAKALDQVIALVKSKEMPRVLQEGLAKKKLKAKGQKRATTYFLG